MKAEEKKQTSTRNSSKSAGARVYCVRDNTPTQAHRNMIKSRTASSTVEERDTPEEFIADVRAAVDDIVAGRVSYGRDWLKHLDE